MRAYFRTWATPLALIGVVGALFGLGHVANSAEGDKIPRKGGPGIMASGMLVINKIDLAPYVGADLAVMDRDAKRMRGERPYVFTNLKTGHGVDSLTEWIRNFLLFES